MTNIALLGHPVTFGTSGHRGIIGKTFTQNHVKAISLAIATHLNQTSDTQPVVAIGYDPRHGNDPELSPDSFTKICVDALLSQGINIYFLTPFTPTPIVSWVITHKHLSGGIILTASHNPPEYNGIKFNTADGAPANTSITSAIELLANQYMSTSPPPTPTQGTLTTINPITAFTIDITHNLTTLLGKPLTIPFPIVIDAKHGTAGQVWKDLLTPHTTSTVQILHQIPDPNFGNITPNPTKIETLTKLKESQKGLNAPVAFSNDPDADRHVILDDTNTPLTPEETTVLIGEYLLSKNIPLTQVISTVASSRLLSQFCTQNHLTYTSTKVGFKYISTHLNQAKQQGQIAIGVESSGGFSTSFHTMEKCGFLPCLLILHLLTDTKTPLSQLKVALSIKYGTHCFAETEVHFNPSDKAAILTLTTQSTLQDLIQKTQLDIHHISQEDGLKLILKNNDWLLVRLSGTEPVARIYAESSTNSTTQSLLETGKELLKSVNRISSPYPKGARRDFSSRSSNKKNVLNRSRSAR